MTGIPPSPTTEQRFTPHREPHCHRFSKNSRPESTAFTPVSWPVDKDNIPIVEDRTARWYPSVVGGDAPKGVKMSRAARKKDSDLQRRMSLLADFVSHMEAEEIWAFLDSLFPNMSEDEKEDLYAQIVLSQEDGGGEPRAAEDVFTEIESERGLTA